MTKNQVIEKLKEMNIDLSDQKDWPKKGYELIVNLPLYKMEMLGLSNNEYITVVGQGYGKFSISRRTFKVNPPEGTRLYQRGINGYAIGHDKIARDAYGKIPNATKFQNRYGYEVPVKVYGWQFSNDFHRWSAYVRFRDGWEGFTYPQVGMQGNPAKPLVDKPMASAGLTSNSYRAGK